MISSPPGKTRIRIPRYSVKPKPNTRNSLQLHLPFSTMGKTVVGLSQGLLAPDGVVVGPKRDFCRATGLCQQKILSSFNLEPRASYLRLRPISISSSAATFLPAAASVVPLGACLCLREDHGQSGSNPTSLAL